MSYSTFAWTRLCVGLGMSMGLGITYAQNAVAGESTDTIRVIVEFKPGMATAARQALAAAGGNVKLEMQDGEAVAVEVPKKMMPALRRHAAIAGLNEDPIRRPLLLEQDPKPVESEYLPGQIVPYGIKMVQADQLPDIHTENRTLCIIDSGYDKNHEDLKDNNVDGEYDSGTGWWYNDELHHGTHVSGIIAAMNNQGVGVVGINPNKHLRLYIVKVFDGNGWAYSSSLAHAAKRCKAGGANVITMSLGGGTPSQYEEKTFQALYDAGILSVAAAGNGGNDAKTYPAGYSSVVSVAAIDKDKKWASFSQYNSDVELAAPGVHVLSTVPMNTGLRASLTVGSSKYQPEPLEGAPVKDAAAPLADFGIGDKQDGSVAGKMCLIERGTNTFADKVTNCQKSGGLGAIIYNNIPGGFTGTLSGVGTDIPSVSVSDKEGISLKAQLGTTATLSLKKWNYAYLDGTSMATPHVSGVAALVWSYFPNCTNAQLRTSLEKSALDIGDPGFDNKTGYGLVQAKAAYDRINLKGCGK